MDFQARGSALGSVRSLIRQRMPLHQRQLQQCEDDGQRHVAPDLEGDPEVSREIAPYQLVDERHDQKEQAPAEGQDAPALGVKLEGGIKDIAEKGFLEDSQ